MPSFESIVRKHFAFLKSEFGFVDKFETLGYEKNGLEIDFYYGKGEIDVIFFVRKSDAIFKPFVSRSFYLFDIARRLKGSKLGRPANIPMSITSLTDEKYIDPYLAYCADIMQAHCYAQLDGDLSIFEQIHTSRRASA